MAADVTITLHLSPAAIEAIVLLLDAEVEAVDDLIADNASATPRFLAEMRSVRDHWECLRAPIAAALRAHEQPAVSGEIVVCPEQHDHNRLQQRCDEDGFPRVCEGCGRRFERVDF